MYCMEYHDYYASQFNVNIGLLALKNIGQL